MRNLPKPNLWTLMVFLVLAPLIAQGQNGAKFSDKVSTFYCFVVANSANSAVSAYNFPADPATGKVTLPFRLTWNSETNEVSLPKGLSMDFEGSGWAELSLEIEKTFRRFKVFEDCKVYAWCEYSDTTNRPIECVDFRGDVFVKNYSLMLYEHEGLEKLNNLGQFLKVIRPRDTADLRNIRIARGGEEIVVDFTTSEGKETKLLSHDIVTVPSLAE